MKKNEIDGGCVKHMAAKRSAYRGLVGKTEGEGSLGRLRMEG
jgi:hypothetical protein